MDPIRDTVLSSTGLKCVSNVAVGFDNIDIPTATSNRVMVTNTPGVLDESTADFAFALLIAAARRVVQADTYTRQGNYKGWEIDLMLGTDVHDATLGIVGIGRIGRGVARRAKGFNMRVLYSDTNPLVPEMEQQLGATHVDLINPNFRDFADINSLVRAGTLPGPEITNALAPVNLLQSYAAGSNLTHQELWGAHQRAAHREHLLLAAGERAGKLLAPLLQPRKQGVNPFLRGLCLASLGASGTRCRVTANCRTGRFIRNSARAKVDERTAVFSAATTGNALASPASVAIS